MTARTPWTLFILCALALALAACGGGSGGGGFLAADPGVDPVEPDPEILATDPANDDQDVDESTEISLDLSEDLDPAAVLADHMKVSTSNGAIEGGWSYDAALRRITFVPNGVLALGAQIEVQMAPGFPYADGRQTNDPFAFAFETRAPAYEGPGYVELLSDPVTRNLFATHPNGNGMALFAVTRSNGQIEYSSRFKPAGGDFEARDAVYLDDGRSYSEQSFAVNARGDAIWAWKRPLSNGDGGYFAIYDRQSNSWGGTKLYQNFINRSIPANPQVGIDDEGNAFIAWGEILVSGEARMGARRYTAAGVLEDAQFFEDETGSTGSFRLSVNARGDAALGWQQVDGTGVASSYGAYYAAGNGWSGQQLLENVQGQSVWTRGMAVAPDGQAVALLAANVAAGGYDEVPQLVRYVPGGPNPGWQAPVPVTADRGGLSDYGMHVTADGTFYAIYSVVQDASYVGYVRAVRYAPLDGTVEPILLSAPQIQEVDPGYLTASVTPGGEVLVAWTEKTTNVNDTIRGAIIRATGQVVPNITLHGISSTAEITDPVAAAGPGGGGIVAWTEPDTVLGGDARRLRSVRIDANGQPGPVEFQDTTPGDRAEDPFVSLDEMGMGALVWTQKNSVTDHADARYRLLR